MQVLSYIIYCISAYFLYRTHVIDSENSEVYLNSDDVRYFDHFTESGNSSYSDNKDYPWLDCGMANAISRRYIKCFPSDQQKPFESFLRQSFGIKTFTDKSFWADVVYANKKTIFEKIDNKELALSFLSYLSRNSNMLFGGEHSFNELKDIPLLRADGSISSDRDYPLYCFDEVAEEMENKSWYTQEFYLLDKAYTKRLDAKARQVLQLEQFNLQNVLNALCDDRSFSIDNIDDCTDFWRWIKNHSKDITDYSIFEDVTIAIIDNIGYSAPELYIPDEYFSVGEGIESLVRQFDESAQFIPTSLLEESTDRSKQEWLRLLKKIGAKSDNKDILNHVIENISDYEDDAVLALLTKHKKEIFDHWSEYEKSLKKLKVRTRGKEFLTLDECIIVKDGDKEAEPFNYILLSNEISPELLKSNSEIICKIAESFNGNNILNGRQEWASHKINEYIDRIQEGKEERENVHVKFIQDLAKWANTHVLDKEQISDIQFRAKGSDDYYDASDITLGSIYKPACNFEQYHIDLNYLSEEYLTDDNKDLIIDFFRKYTDVHYKFEKNDIEYMSNHDFALYIWYIKLKSVPEIQNWVEEGLFDDVECIPTALGMKMPEDVYSPTLLEYAQYCVDATDIVPSIDMQKLENAKDVFLSLPFKQSLDSQDCLSFLLNSQERDEDENKHRKQIIEWLLENDDLTDDEVETYRANPNAKWKNGKGQYIHISSLYAIHPDSRQERSIFNSNENIIRTWCFPDDIEQFEDICDKLAIQILKNSDFETLPIEPIRPQTNELLEKIKVRLLIIAGSDHENKYAKYYEKYIDTISKYHFYSCSRIEIRYKDLHETVGQVYVDENHSNIYYVNSWDNKRTYSKFCHTLRMLLNINLSDDICEEVFDETMSVEELVNKYCYSLRSDKDFIKYMEDLKQRIIALEETVENNKVSNVNYETSDAEEETNKDSTQHDTNLDNTQDNNDYVDRQNETNDEIEEFDKNDNDENEDTDFEEVINEEEGEEITTLPTELQSTHNRDNFKYVKKHKVLVGNEEHEVVCEHYRDGTWVRDYQRSDGTWVRGHWRSAAVVSEHERTKPEQTNHATHTHASNTSTPDDEQGDKEKQYTQNNNKTNQPLTSTSSSTDNHNNHQSTSPMRNSSNRTNIDYDDIDEADGAFYCDDETNYTSDNYMVNRQNYKHLNTDWKQKENQKKMQVADITDDECQEIQSYLSTNKTPEEIINEHYLVRYRLYNALLAKGILASELGDKKDFVLNSDDKEIKTNKGYIYARSAKGGILFLSSFLWKQLQSGKGRICIYYGNKAYDFELVESTEELERIVGKDNIIVQIAGNNKLAAIDAVFNGNLSETEAKAHVLIRIKSNERYNSLFASTFSSNDSNDTNF